MSASTTQPMAGPANQSAPLGAVAILVGALALGAVGILIGTTYKAAPAAEAPARAYPGAITGPSTIDDRGLDSPLHKGSIRSRRERPRPRQPAAQGLDPAVEHERPRPRQPAAQGLDPAVEHERPRPRQPAAQGLDPAVDH